MEKNATSQISDKEFDQLFTEDSVEKTNAFTITPEKSDVDKLLDKGNSANNNNDDDDPTKVNDKDIDDLLDKGADNLDDDDQEGNDDLQSTVIYKAIDTLVKDGVLQVFVDDEGKPEKELSEYTAEELVDLITENINTAIETTASNAPVEVFKTFPKAVQDVITYTISGGKEEQLKGLFQQLAQVQDTLDLKPEVEEDAKKIIKQYLELENLHTAEEIEDQITKIADLDKVTEYATKYKKVLDAKQAAVLQKRINDQENEAAEQKKKDLELNKKIYESLKVPFEDLNLDAKTRESLYHGLVQKKHLNDKGEPINELDYLVKQKLSGTKEDTELLIKAFAYLKSPETFLENLETKIRAKIEKQLLDELKDGNQRTATSSVESRQGTKKRQLSGTVKKANIFARNNG